MWSSVEIRFRSPNFNRINEDWTREFMILNLPWKIGIRKVIAANNESWIFMQLYCAKHDCTLNWKHTVYFQFKIWSIDRNVVLLEMPTIPHVFDCENRSIGPPYFRWDLISNYVVDNCLKMSLTITIANEEEENKSDVIAKPLELIIEEIDRSLFEVYSTKLQLIINNIADVKITRTIRFKIRTESWCFVIYKTKQNRCDVCVSSKAEILQTGQIEATFNLISTKPDTHSIRAIITEEIITSWISL